MLARVFVLLALSRIAFAEPSVETRLGAQVNAGSLSILGSRHAAVGAGLDTTITVWLNQRIGIGVRASTLVYSPSFVDVAAAANSGLFVVVPITVDRWVPWLVEPSLQFRTAIIPLRRLTIGWQLGVGAGLARVRAAYWWDIVTFGSAPMFADDKMTSSQLAVTASLGTGPFLSYRGLSVYAGPRLSGNSVGDIVMGVGVEVGGRF